MGAGRRSSLFLDIQPYLPKANAAQKLAHRSDNQHAEHNRNCIIQSLERAEGYCAGAKAGYEPGLLPRQVLDLL